MTMEEMVLLARVDDVSIMAEDVVVGASKVVEDDDVLRSMDWIVLITIVDEVVLLIPEVAVSRAIDDELVVVAKSVDDEVVLLASAVGVAAIVDEVVLRDIVVMAPLPSSDLIPDAVVEAGGTTNPGPAATADAARA